MKSSANIQGLQSTPTTGNNHFSNTNHSRILDNRFKQKTSTTVSTSKMSAKSKLGSLENIQKESLCRSGNNGYGNRMKAPNNLHERYSAGSPAKLSTPLSTLRGSDVALKVHTPEIFTTTRFETPKRNVSHQPGAGVETSNLVVAVRIRPLTAKEESAGDMKPVIQVKGNEMSVLTDYGQTHSFNYDHCFFSNSPSFNKQSDQAKVYESLAKPLLCQAFKGFNTCLFAYGQTGSGKSYSVMGHVGCERELVEASGIVPRFCFDLFRKVGTLLKNSAENLSVEIQISYFEIYKEKIQDLLSPSSKLGGSLRVREHPQNGPYVVDLTKHTVNSFEEVQRWLVVGNRQRATAATSANERSSRSHAIFTITLTQSQEEKLGGKSHEVRKQSRINFIDLAGSERVASTHSVGERREEGLTINQSLLTLGRVITALAEQSFVPYRESVLTWLLKESLGGDSKTVMLATASPCAGHVEETLSTLRYACQARKIINTARICEDPNTRHIRHLREQIKLMEHRLAEANLPSSAKSVAAGNNVPESSLRVQELEAEIQNLKARLAEVENQKDVSWQERVTQAETRRAEAEEALANYGLPKLKDSHQPCLVNVNQDPLLSGTLLFPLKNGQNWVGPPVCSSEPPAIQLTGLMIEENHCCIEYSETLRLTANAETYVNGQLVSSDGVLLHHGDRVIIGGTHYFHLHYPRDIKLTGTQSKSKIPDFETAYEELKCFQEKRLQQAVEEAKEKARLQLLNEMEEFRQEAALEISLQRHSYEDEIASLNRVIKDRQQCNDTFSPPLGCPTTPTTDSKWEEIQALLQETEQKLALPANNSPKESSFLIQSMLNEFNAISRRFQQPFTFSRKDMLVDDLQSTICVHDRDRRLVMHWSIEKARQRLKEIRETVDESGSLPVDGIFDSGDMWQLEDDALALFAPAIREQLDKLLKGHDRSMNVLDESRFSIDSSRRSSLLPRSPTIHTGVAENCKQFLLNFSQGNFISSFCNAATGLQSIFSYPERTANFAISLSLHTVSLLSAYPGLVDSFLSKTSVPMNIQVDYLQKTKELGQRLQNSVDFIMQGIALDSVGLFNDWLQRAQMALEAILENYFGLSVLCCNEVSNFGMFTAATAIAGFVSTQKEIHQAIVSLAVEIRMKIAELPDENSVDSLDNSSFINNGRLVKACHDSVTQIQILLEGFTESIDCPAAGEMNLGTMHSKFHQRINILLRMGGTIEHLLSYLELADLSQVKLCAAALEVQATAYANLMDLSAETVLCEVSFAVSTVHKTVAERRRMTALRRGRDIIYSPLPARLLASPSRKPCQYNDVSESEIDQDSSLENTQSDDETLEDLSISTTAIRKALLFQTPSRSSLKTTANTNRHTKSVRFNISDSPFKQATAL